MKAKDTISFNNITKIIPTTIYISDLFPAVLVVIPIDGRDCRKHITRT